MRPTIVHVLPFAMALLVFALVTARSDRASACSVSWHPDVANVPYELEAWFESSSLVFEATLLDAGETFVRLRIDHVFKDELASLQVGSIVDVPYFSCNYASLAPRFVGRSFIWFESSTSLDALSVFTYRLRSDPELRATVDDIRLHPLRTEQRLRERARFVFEARCGRRGLRCGLPRIRAARRGISR